MFKDIMRDIVIVIKQSGEQFEDIRASVQSDKIIIDNIMVPIEEGDKVVRKLPNGLLESYLIIDRGYREKFHGMPAHYSLKVKKESLIETEKNSTSMHFNIGAVYGSNVGISGNALIENVFDFSKVNQLIEEKGGTDKEELRMMIDEIRELFEGSEKVKKGSLSKFSELMERHSWITGTVAQMGLGFLTGALFK